MSRGIGMEPIISLCLPTNGISEWVFPVLNSIYSQNISEELFEVIVTDNGCNEDFYQRMKAYECDHCNLIYRKTTAFMFDNQLEALKLANGTYFKFVNHRALFLDGSLKQMIEIIQQNVENKPIIYFSNGELNFERYELSSFDDFVKTLRRYVSWTTGVGIWKDDYKKIPIDKKYDKISPHSAILFSERNKSSYIIENYVFSKEVDDDQTKKGTYDLFKAFAVEEVTIALNLYIDGDISAKTLKTVMNDYKKYCSELYFYFCVRKCPCSYDLSGLNDSMGIFFKKREIIIMAYLGAIIRYMRRIKSVIFGGKK